VPQPFIKFYLRDWDSDAELTSCSLAAQGLWLRMMRVMHEAEPYGFFVGRSGEAVDVVAFAKRLMVKPREVKGLMDELEEAGVCSRDSQGRLYSRRMVRDFAASQQGREFGRDGGNPRLKGGLNPPALTPLDKTPIKEGDNPRLNLSRASIARSDPESRYQIDTDSLRSSALTVGPWPQEIQPLRALALLFVAEFANCRDAVKAEKHVGPYTVVLATMRSRGVTIEQSWTACVDARDACGGRPLWGAAVKSAISFLPARSVPTLRPIAGGRPARTGDGAADLDRALREIQER